MKLDPATGREETRIALPILGPVGLGAHQIFAAGESSMWVLEGAGGIDVTSLVRIDPAEDRIIARIPLGMGGAGLAFGPEGLWVLNANGRLSEIDVQDRSIGRTIDLGVQAGGLAVAGGFLWVTSNLAETLYQVDPSDESVRTIDLAGGADAIAATRPACGSSIGRAARSCASSPGRGRSATRYGSASTRRPSPSERRRSGSPIPSRAACTASTPAPAGKP
jgi:hypothetical protein